MCYLKAVYFQFVASVQAFRVLHGAFLLCSLTVTLGNLLAHDTSSPLTRHRVIVSTDIGGTDPDDFQSLVHLLVYADYLDIEGLISSPFGPGRKEHILQVIDHYDKDYSNLKSYSDNYPTPDELRALTKQGETEVAPYTGIRHTTEGSQWIVTCAKREDSRPLNVLVWGGLEDLAQALHDAPNILPKLRIYWIGGPNKKWSPDAYQYIVDNHPDLWFIEANSTYRGWFVGGDQIGRMSNTGFVSSHITGRGSLGDFFATQLGGTLKMGDTPSVGWLLKGNPSDPSQSGWGGKFVHAWERPFACFDRLTNEKDRIEQFGILELRLPLVERSVTDPKAHLEIENQKLDGFVADHRTIRFRFCPKDAKTYDYSIRSNIPSIDGKSGKIVAVAPSPTLQKSPARELANWWTDDIDPVYAEGAQLGAKTVNRWRAEYLADFATRMLRCQVPAPQASNISKKDN